MSFDVFVRDYHSHMATNPNACVTKGIDVHLDDLPDPSLQHAADTTYTINRLLTQLDDIDRSKEDFDTQLDIDLARLSLEAEQHRLCYQFNGRSERAQKPTAGDDIGDGIFLLFANDPRPACQRLDNITARLEKVPAYLDQLLHRLDTPVARWLQMDQEKVTGLPQLFDTLSGWAKKEDYRQASRLEAACTKAEQALESYRAALTKLPTTDDLHLSDHDARRIVALRGIDKTFEDLHAMATSFLAETQTAIEELRIKLAQKYGLDLEIPTQALQDFLNQRFRVAAGDLDAILDRYHAERKQILAFIRDRDLFPIIEDQDLRILRTPPFMQPSIPAGAMMSPPPFRDGVRMSLIYITLRDDLVDEHTEISIPTMMIHEGIPGHHLQLATASKHPSYIRRHFDAMEHAEGWTTMLEDYMLDQGYLGDLTDEARFCGKRDLSRIGARVAIDLYFMTGNRDYLDVGIPCDVSPTDPFAAAGNLLYATTGFTPGRIQAELNWYSQERGYPLCYLTGNRLVWQLKQDLAQAQSGRDFTDLDREFHKIYLQSGNMPVTFLRRVLQNRGLLPAQQ